MFSLRARSRFRNMLHVLSVFSVCARYPKQTVQKLMQMRERGFEERMRKQKPPFEGLRTVSILSILPDLDEDIGPYAFLDGGSLITDMALLRGLARRRKVAKYFEIGTWRGESIANVAAVVPECVSLSLSEDEMRALGWTEDYVKISRFFSKDLPNVTHIKADSRTYDFSPHYSTCDLVFIDGDHSYEGVRSDTQSALRLLRDRSSVIVWHDYARNPEGDTCWSVYAGIMDGLPESERQSVYHVSNTLCAVLLREPLSGQVLHSPLEPDKVFKIKVQAKPCGS